MGGGSPGPGCREAEAGEPWAQQPPPEELSRRLPSGPQDVRKQMCGWDVRVRAWVPRVGAEGRGPRRVRVRAGKEPRPR